MSQSTMQEQQLPLAGAVRATQDMHIKSLVNNEASTGIPFGACVILDLADDEAALEVVDGTGTPAGVVVRSDRYSEPDELDENDLLTPDTEMGVLDNGLIGVLVEDAVTSLDDQVRVRHVAGTGFVGQFRTAAVGGETVPLNSARWDTLGGAGTVVYVRLNALLTFGTPD